MKSFFHRFGSKIVSNSTGIILNDHIRLFSKSKTSPNYIKHRKRPLNWYTPILMTDLKTRYPVLLLSAAGGGVNNFQVVAEIVYNFYLDNIFERIPTVAQVVNQIRYVFAYYQRYHLGNASKFEIISKDPTIFTETAFMKKNMMDALNDSDILFSQPFNFQIGNPSNFSFVSGMLLEDSPSPLPYSDARGRGKGDYKWISKFSFINWFSF